jgi:hypothetical protein
MATGSNAAAGVGSGGLITKLAAARIAHAAGCSTLITLGNRPHPLGAIEAGERVTLIAAKISPAKARAAWLEGHLKPEGEILVDDGAAKALANGASLLAVGVRGVTGQFERGAAVAVRDTAGRTWPCFYQARLKGTGQVNAGAGSGSFTVFGPHDQVQNAAGHGHLQRRLGARPQHEQTYSDLEVSVTLTSATTATGLIQYNGRSIKASGPIGLRDSKPSGNGINLHGLFKVSKRDLGLARGDDDQEDLVIIEYWAPGRP